ncbi:MAG: Holliday junction branch migration protein RuvA [Nitrospirota bacterium]|nr:Holliday junction branch migration protein RuvA [Nitrospirota bacterium]
MIASLTGTLSYKSPAFVIIDVHGVGYQVALPLSTFYALPDVNNTVSLQIHTHVREDALLLYGFSRMEEKEAFLMLQDVSGIGPKLALNILSGITVEELTEAIRREDKARLSLVPGVGPKTAGRIALELKGKMDHLACAALEPVAAGSAPVCVSDDALSALMNLGYKRPQAEDAIKRVSEGQEDMVLGDVLKQALKLLAK